MRAYLSSTFADLVDHRERAARALRSLKIEVITMEDYVASDERPVDLCLADVESVDLYVGLFAFRYGYIPKTQNPESRSITELEYRRAVDRGIPRLIFLVPEDAQWEMPFIDAMAEGGDRGERIRKLRATLASERLLSTFTTPDELAAVVTSSASRWLLSRQIERANREQSDPASGATSSAAELRSTPVARSRGREPGVRPRRRIVGHVERPDLDDGVEGGVLQRAQGTGSPRDLGPNDRRPPVPCDRDHARRGPQPIAPDPGPGPRPHGWSGGYQCRSGSPDRCAGVGVHARGWSRSGAR